eukprot:987146-Rhodomonas_salina.2
MQQDPPSQEPERGPKDTFLAFRVDKGPYGFGSITATLATNRTVALHARAQTARACNGMLACVFLFRPPSPELRECGWTWGSILAAAPSATSSKLSLSVPSFPLAPSLVRFLRAQSWSALLSHVERQVNGPRKGTRAVAKRAKAKRFGQQLPPPGSDLVGTTAMQAQQVRSRPLHRRSLRPPSAQTLPSVSSG